MTARGTVVVTGAAGQIGTAIRPFLARLFASVRLVDVAPMAAEVANEAVFVGDVCDDALMRRAFENADALIHLAGIASHSPWQPLLQANVENVATLLSCAESSGVRRVALASTMHVMGMYQRTDRIAPHMPARADSPSAATKLLGEQAGRWHAARTGARVVAVRIGCFKLVREDSEPCAWIGPDDLARLFHHVLMHPRGGADVVHAVAPHFGDDCGQRALWWRHGFRFRHRGESMRRSLQRLSWWYPSDMTARQYRGGEFASKTLGSYSAVVPIVTAPPAREDVPHSRPEGARQPLFPV